MRRDWTGPRIMVILDTPELAHYIHGHPARVTLVSSPRQRTCRSELRGLRFFPAEDPGYGSSALAFLS
jgi:hypothetical protein